VKTCAYCGDLLCHDDATTCTICDEPHCASHTEVCLGCDEPHCVAHSATCAECDFSFCTDHLEECSNCGELVCRTDRETCDSCGETACLSDTADCIHCHESFCAEHHSRCGSCDSPVCTADSTVCVDDEDWHCHEHIASCSVCHDETDFNQPRCQNHLQQCVVDEANLCSGHAHTDPVLQKAVCAEHQTTCDTCRQPVSTAAVDNGKCGTCRELAKDESLQPEVEAKLPDSLSFRSMRIGTNPSYVVVHGKRLMRSNEIVVLERDTGEIIEQYRTGLLARLSGGRL